MFDVAVDRAEPARDTVELDRAARLVRTTYRAHDTVWRCWGDGPPVLLLHGAFGSWTHWLRTIPDLARDYQVFAPDMPGFGDSDVPISDNALEALPAALLDGLQGTLGLHRPLAVVGFSFGTVMAGAFSALLAESDPPLLRSLVVTAPAGLGIATRRFEDLRSLRPEMTAAEQRELHRYNLGVVMLADDTRITEDTIDIQVANTGRARISGRPYSRSDALVRACRRLPLERLDAIWGTRDAYALRNEPRYSEAVRQLRPDVRVRNVPGAGHWVQYEEPVAYNAALRECLDGAMR